MFIDLDLSSLIASLLGIEHWVGGPVSGRLRVHLLALLETRDNWLP